MNGIIHWLAIVNEWKGVNDGSYTMLCNFNEVYNNMLLHGWCAGRTTLYNVEYVTSFQDLLLAVTLSLL